MTGGTGRLVNTGVEDMIDAYSKFSDPIVHRLLL